MTMSVDRACESMRAFLLGTESNRYGPKMVVFDPPGIEEYLGPGKFMFSAQYLYTISISIAYSTAPPEDARKSIDCVDGRPIYGDTMIFGRDEGGPMGLTDFDITAIKNNLVMATDVKGNYYRLENVSLKPRIPEVMTADAP